MSELADALRRAGVAEVDESTRRRAEYSSDASNYRVVPAAVAYPRDGAEVAAALDVCRGFGVALTMRGGGTSIAGNAIGPGLVLDTSRYLTQLRVDPETETAEVEPGVILDDLQRAAAPHGLRFGPDPSTHSRATLGGMIGNNACGSRALERGRGAGAGALRDRDGNVVAAVNVAGPIGLFTRDTINETVLPALARIAHPPVDLPPMIGGSRLRR